ncbi:MAG: ABC transporter ATP-binding protein [Gracilibacteraceae bacterium]|jgi:peptide/nickel transport system ATP-binding protein|nr:ABC transporter ATP-binding protein [Gracilibacteraceae bacterium]
MSIAQINSNAADPILQIRSLKQYFPLGKKGGQRLFVKAVDDVSLDIGRGEILGLVGESGSGKSTLAYSVVGLYRPSAGQILFEGEKIGARRPLPLRKDIQIVFQDPGSSLNPRQTIGEILELPLKVHFPALKSGERQKRVRELLQMVELPAAYAWKTPGAIGSGEKQMAAIARALAPGPKFIILDEPTSALDVSIQAKIINMLLRLRREHNLTYLFITHDLSLMRNIATRVIILYLGRVAEIAGTEDFFRRPTHPYTQMLLSSIPVLGAEDEALKPARILSQGEIPSPVNLPTGCSFHQRCHAVLDRCPGDDPSLRQIGAEHWVRCHRQ